MEEDTVVKAPVTRLRRRLSVEQTEEKTTTPNTPTKKRTRQAKPQLDLIDENAVTPQKSTPKRLTRKAAKEALEPVEEKQVTPARRSARIKSNTSIVSDTAPADTPKAKRVTRRFSQLESDTEAPLTPTRQTRRTRKESTTSLDKVDAATKPSPVTDTITEETEKDTKKSPSATETLKKSQRNSTSPWNNKDKVKINITNDVDKVKRVEDISTELDTKGSESINTKKETSKKISMSPDIQKENISPRHDKKCNLSESTINLINNVDLERCPKKDIMNKTSSCIETNVKRNIKRTKSWSTICTMSDEHSKVNDNNSKKSLIDKIYSPISNDKGSGDGISSNVESQKDENSQDVCKDAVVVLNRLNVQEDCNLSREQLFNNEPCENSKPEIIIEDTEPNLGKEVHNSEDAEDQCVPVISVDTIPKKDINDKNLNKSIEKVLDNSVEPMDIDQTIPESLIIAESDDKESSCNMSDNTISQRNNLTTKSSRKSSLSQACDKTENKSTLIISQIKDISSTESNRLGKSPLPSYDKSLNKSIADLDKTQSNEIERKSLSLTCLTSTPLQQKQFHKLTAPGNTSIIKANDNIQGNIKSSFDINSPLKDKSKLNLNDDELSNAKNELINDKASSISSLTKPDDSLKIKSLEPNKELMNDISSDNNTSKAKSRRKKMSENASSANDTSSDESRTKNDLVNDEASDAGDSYESGDSQDEDELQYAKENEIIDKGETLTSGDEIPDDSDYEKDSFVVSSDEEDNILLEGTEDDLSMSDNELKMTTKSKKKYNERMAKEQKKASREMFEARHKLNVSKRQKNKIDDSSDSSDSDNTPKKQKRNNRMRLDSSHDTSGLNESRKSSTEETKRLTKSVHNDSVLKEMEITAMHNESAQENDPLETSIKKEPKTPKENMNTTLDFISIKATGDTNVTQENDKTKHENSKDPLIPSENDESSSSDSDTNNIIDNYESILNDLNKVKSPKTCDISLNIELKNKTKKNNATIIDELNLTQIKSGKLSKKEKLGLKRNIPNLERSVTNMETDTTPTQESVSKKTSSVKESEDDSSSDSIDLHLLISEDSNTDSINIKINEDKNAIPLKHTEAKTDIRINKDENVEEDDNFEIVIDTKGSDNVNSSIQFPEYRVSNTSADNGENLNLSSAKKKKKKNLSQSLIVQDEETAVNEIMIMSSSNIKTPESKKKKKQRLSEVQIVDVTDSPTNISISEKLDYEQQQNVSVIKTPKSDKKKKKMLLKPEADNIEDQPSEHIQDENVSSVKTPKSNKKKNRQSSELKTDNSEDIPVETQEEQDVSLTIAKTPKSEKKMKKLSVSLIDTIEGPIIEEVIHKEQDVSELHIKTPKSDKKKKNLLSTSQGNITEVASTEDVVSIEQDGNESSLKTPKSEKKKKKLLFVSQTDLEDLPVMEIISKDQDSNLSSVKTPKSDKKKNKLLSKSSTDTKEGDENNSFNKSLESNGKKTKKPAELQEQHANAVYKDAVKDDLVSKKRKRSLTTQPEDILIGVINPLQPNGNQNKKRKISDTIKETVPTAVVKKNKKRKEREDDESIQSKVQQGSSHKISIPRLPVSVIEQLDEKPKIQVKKKPKVISTSQFEVQDVRRKKPSNYLEESVYLNEDSPEKKKQKKNIRKPKVLPTMPTCSSSNSGFTTNFKINVLPKETKFVAQVSSNTANFREDRLYNKNIKRLGTYELYKKQRSLKLSKF